MRYRTGVITLWDLKKYQTGVVLLKKKNCLVFTWGCDIFRHATLLFHECA